MSTNQPKADSWRLLHMVGATDLPKAAKRLLCAGVAYLDIRTLRMHPAIARLALETGWSDRHPQRRLNEFLIPLGILTPETARRGGTGRAGEDGGRKLETGGDGAGWLTSSLVPGSFRSLESHSRGRAVRLFEKQPQGPYTRQTWTGTLRGSVGCPPIARSTHAQPAPVRQDNEALFLWSLRSASGNRRA